MNRQMRADAKEENLYWNGARAQFRLKLPGEKGREVWKSFGEVSPEVARLLTRQRRRELLDRWQLQQMGLAQPEVEEKPVSTFAELFAAMDEWGAGAMVEERTVRETKGALKRVVREARGIEDVDGASLAILKGEIVTDYEAKRIEAAKRETKALKASAEEAARIMTRAQTTVYSTVHQARSVFGRRQMASKPYRKLVLPATLTEFMQQPVEGSTRKRYQRPAAAVIDRVLEGIRGLKAARPQLWLAAMLAVNIGMRRSSGVQARWDWFVDLGERDDETGEAIVTCRIQVAKGRLSEPAIHKSLFQEMEAVRVDAGPYIVPGATEKERYAVFEALKDLLRELGLDRRMPNHELRKLYVDSLRRRRGVDAALNATGHSDPRLLEAYSEARGRVAERLA